MSKMYYSEEEACQALAIDQDTLMNQFVNTGKLQMYNDGAKNVFKAEDIDALSEAAGEKPGSDAVSLLEEISAEPDEPLIKKEDTVITAQGISIFDDEDLEIEEADPLAATQIAPSLDDQIALDGVGSGGGLLDLTRESDDTSLGGVLDQIDVDGGSGLAGGLSGLSGSGLVGSGLAGSGLGSGLAGDIPSGLGSGLGGSGLGEVATLGTAPSDAYAPMPTEEPTYIEVIDSGSGFLGGMLIGVMIMGILAVIAALASRHGLAVKLVAGLQEKMLIVVIGAVVVTLACGFFGLVFAKSSQTKAAAMKRMGM